MKKALLLFFQLEKRKDKKKRFYGNIRMKTLSTRNSRREMEEKMK